MRYYRINEDWISHLDGEFRRRLIGKLRELQLERLQKFPPPKIGGLPFGNETRIASRFLEGRSLQLEASALSRFYLSRLSTTEALLYRAFRMNESLTRKEWQTILNETDFADWIENKCLWNDKGDDFFCTFTVVAIDGLVFCLDLLSDHGNLREPPFVFRERAEDVSSFEPFYHTYIGLDSLRMIEWMDREEFTSTGRFLDCGTGSGGLLLYFGRNFDEAVGLDINPRAAKLAKFNAELNEMDNVNTVCDDAINRKSDLGRFDLVSWNLPFIFMPENYGDEYIDGYGGEFGIGLCLQFIETLRPLLSENGLACIAALAPILDNGENVLTSRLKPLLSSSGLNCTLKVAQISLADSKELWDFHHANRIRKFESVYLFLKPGTGCLTRVESPGIRRSIDILRESFYKRKYGTT